MGAFRSSWFDIDLHPQFMDQAFRERDKGRPKAELLRVFCGIQKLMKIDERQPVSRLKLSLFGPPRLERDGQPVNLGRRKAMAMLAYLALTAKPHSRDTLATLFWPDVSQSRARGNLRRLLSDLNREIGAGLLGGEGENIFLNAEEGLWVDVVRFRNCLAARMEHNHPPGETCPSCIPLFEEAAALYAADFLAGFTLRGTLEFDDWQYFQTEGLRQELAKVLERLADGLSARGDYEGAIPYARRWLAIDPLHEPSQLLLMQLYDRVGRSSAALRQYELYAELVNDELGAQPGSGMLAFYERIRSGQKLSASEHPHPVLPVQPTSFIGREQEQADIARLLQTDQDCRLITLLGPGGIGKTRLALETAKLVVEAFRDGTAFVSLASVHEASFIVTAIAAAIEFNFQREADPKKQLLFHLSQKSYLLILDNFEQLLYPSGPSQNTVHEGGELLSEILRIAPHVKLLVTSRERLRLQEEWIYAVQGMPFPAHTSIDESDKQKLEHFAAVQLFLERARKADPRFSPSTAEMQAIIRICQLVGGIPLGIELAAPWVRLMACQEIAAEIERCFDLLGTSLQNVPERHRSMRAVLEQTWQHLSAQEQTTLLKLSVFRGGCLREAAEAVTGANLMLLASLVDKALIHRTPSARYELHELIRQFAFEQLQVDAEACSQALDLHYRYYAGFLEAQVQGLKGGPQLQTVRMIASEIDNIRAAWQRAVEVRDSLALEKAAECIYLYSELKGALAEGESAFRQAAALFDPLNGGNTARENSLKGYLLVAQGSLHAHSGDLQGAEALLESGLGLLDAKNKESYHLRKRAFALMQMGWLLFLQAKNTKVEHTLQESISLYDKVGERWGIARNLSILGNSLTGSGRLAEAEGPLRRSLAICQEIGDRRSCVLVNWNLAILKFWFGEYDQTQGLLTDAALLAREFDDQTGLALALKELGKLEVARGNYSQAIDTLHESIEITDKIGSQWESAATLDDLGFALCLAGDDAAAENAWRRCLAASQARQHRYFIARSTGNLGLLAYHRENYQLASRQLQQALDIWTDLGHEPYSAWVLCQLGHVFQALDQEHFEKSRQAYDQALQLSLKHGLDPIMMDIHTGQASLLLKIGETQKAIELLGMVASHPASYYETRQNARKLLKGTHTDRSVDSRAHTGQRRDQKTVNAKQPYDERRLAAIMFTDMVGFTTLAQRDEALAMQLLDEQRELIRSLLAKYRGREVETTGDGFLVEFASSLGAVRCAVEIQTALKQLNERRRETERILIRIGIHLGDIIYRGMDVAGDAVNVASRIEALAPPGGICVTAPVCASVLNKVECRFESLGAPRLKNVATPIEVFQISGYGQSERRPRRQPN
jgi:DNA-binding SARP family transcriptional activator/class 3 adenylate cyclase/predicted ATPase